MSDPSPVVVYWIDSREDGDWQTFENVTNNLKPATIITRGWLIDMDTDCVRVCRDWIEGEWSGGGFIAISTKDIIRVEHRHQTTRI